MTFTSKDRQALFMDMARSPDGTTAQEVFDAGKSKGDQVSLEAYFNVGRRLTHRGMLRAEKSKTSDRTTFVASLDENSTWLDEDQLVMLVDPDYPVLALTAYRESQRQARDIPDSAWIEARERLASADARSMFHDAIVSYAENLKDEIENYAIERGRGGGAELAELRRTAENVCTLLIQLCKYGLGLSDQAIRLPVSIDGAVEQATAGTLKPFYDATVLRDELQRRIEEGPLVRLAEVATQTDPLLIAGVDGSSVGGLLSMDGAAGDFAFGQAPQVSLNTATGVLNRSIQIHSERVPAFFRLPEKPEDMQQRDNRYSIMAKMFFPDLTDSEYIHSTWNAMDLLECRATLAVMSRWSTAVGQVEVPAADVVFRDGTVVPNDRDMNHYGQQDNYGRIVRDLIESNWRIAKNCSEDSQTVVGVVKNAQLRVLTPVVNHFLCQLAASKDGGTQFAFWSLSEMNLLFDQTLMTRVLTAGRTQTDPWWRTALILRPFHATTNLAKNASREQGKTPCDRVVQRGDEARARTADELTFDDEWWRTMRVPGDPYLQMISGVWYAGFYLGAHPRLDRSELLPRMEFVLPHPTAEVGAFPADACAQHLTRALSALEQVGFDVAKEHSMYDAAERIDLLPRILVRAHDTVKTWAKELRDRVSEYMDWHVSRYLNAGQKRGLRLRPWKRHELASWVDAMHRERRGKAGARRLDDR